MPTTDDKSLNLTSPFFNKAANLNIKFRINMLNLISSSHNNLPLYDLSSIRGGNMHANHFTIRNIHFISYQDNFGKTTNWFKFAVWIQQSPLQGLEFRHNTIHIVFSVSKKQLKMIAL